MESNPMESNPVESNPMELYRMESSQIESNPMTDNDTDGQNYYKAYQGTITDTVKTEQMNEVIAHFQNKGYTIARKSSSGTYFYWEITW